MSEHRPVVAFVGTGVMGAPMAGHLMDAGYPVVVCNRTKAKAQPLLERGAAWAGTPGEAAAAADVTITMIGFPDEVEAAYFAADGILASAPEGALLVDMSTSPPALAVRIAQEAKARGLEALDAPVSGGDVGARTGSLTIMVGGSQAAFERAVPLFQVMGSTFVLQGGPGAGQHTKMANQIAIAATMLSVCESLAYARRVGLDPERVLSSIGAGSAGSWSLANLAPRMLAGDFAPGFYVKHFVKDLRIALDTAVSEGVALPGLELALKLYERLAGAGGADLGTQALWLLYAAEEERARAGIDRSAAVTF